MRYLDGDLILGIMLAAVILIEVSGMALMFASTPEPAQASPAPASSPVVYPSEYVGTVSHNGKIWIVYADGTAIAITNYKQY